MLEDTQILTYLQELQSELFTKNNIQCVELTKEWVSKFPNEAGVYVLIDRERVVYVGETGNISARMRDMTDSRHHCVRRTLGTRLFSSLPNFVQATTKRKFPSNIEEMLDSYMRSNFEILHIVVSLGRKELEELLIDQLDPEYKLNNRGKRKSSKRPKTEVL